MEDKSTVISVLRALLLSNTKKGQIPLHELVQDYCTVEGKKSVPIFGHKSVSEFMLDSGEFKINVVDGIVMVREKTKLESSHVKKLVTEQNSSYRRRSNNSRSNNRNRFNNSSKFMSTFNDGNSRSRQIVNQIKHKDNLSRKSSVPSNYVKIPNHRPSFVFTFDDMMKEIDIETPIALNSLKQPVTTQPEVSKSAKVSNEKHGPSIKFTFNEITTMINGLKNDSLKQSATKQSEVYSNSSHRNSHDLIFEESSNFVNGQKQRSKSASLHRDRLNEKENHAVTVAENIEKIEVRNIFFSNSFCPQICFC